MGTETSKRTIVVFDFDGTITRCDSFIRFVKATVGVSRLCRGLILQFPRLVGYKLGIVNNGKAKEALFGYYFRNMPISTFEDAGKAYASTLNDIIRQDTQTILQEYIRSGHDVYIVTASMPQWIAPWAKSIGIKAVIGTEPEVNTKGLLTGRFATPNCYGSEKPRRFLMVEPNRSSYRLIAYGDSVGDKDMLTEADEIHWV